MNKKNLHLSLIILYCMLSSKPAIIKQNSNALLCQYNSSYREEICADGYVAVHNAIWPPCHLTSSDRIEIDIFEIGVSNYILGPTFQWIFFNHTRVNSNDLWNYLEQDKKNTNVHLKNSKHANFWFSYPIDLKFIPHTLLSLLCDVSKFYWNIVLKLSVNSHNNLWMLLLCLILLLFYE